MASSRYVVLGTSIFTLALARGILSTGGEIVGLVSLPRHARPLNSVDISSFSLEHAIPYFECHDLDEPATVAELAALNAEYVFSSWPHLLRARALGIAQRMIIGTHPTCLPANRGRHPLHWLIALGIPETTLSFFRMTRGIDAGPILHTVPITLDLNIDILRANALVADAAFEGAQQLCYKLTADPAFDGVPQDDTQKNTWRRRTPYDVTLDLRCSCASLDRTIRSFAPPYPCAALIVGPYVLRIAEGRRLHDPFPAERLKRIEPGRILSINEHEIVVKVDDALMSLTAVDVIPPAIQAGDEIHPPARYIAEYRDEILRLLLV